MVVRVGRVVVASGPSLVISFSAHLKIYKDIILLEFMLKYIKGSFMNILGYIFEGKNRN